MEIKINYSVIMQNFEDNHNRRKYFTGEDATYWELISKAITVAYRMAKHYSATKPSEFSDDHLFVGGGGGGNEKYDVFVSHHKGFWQGNVGRVIINFKTRQLSVSHVDFPESLKYGQEIPYNKYIDVAELNEIK